MEKKHPWLLIQHMVVNRNYLDATFSKRLYHRIDFHSGHDDIARYMRLFIGSYKSGPGIQPHTRG